MINLTNNDYRKIQAWLKANAIKDSEMESADHIQDTDIISIVQDNKSKKVSLSAFIPFLTNNIIAQKLGDNADVTMSQKAITSAIEDIVNKYATRNNAVGSLRQGSVDTAANRVGMGFTWVNVEGDVMSDDGIYHTIPSATTTKAGVMSANDKVEVDKISKIISGDIPVSKASIAGVAEVAEFAGDCDNANYAETAEKDLNGNSIVQTYATKKELASKKDSIDVTSLFTVGGSIPGVTMEHLGAQPLYTIVNRIEIPVTFVPVSESTTNTATNAIGNNKGLLRFRYYNAVSGLWYIALSLLTGGSSASCVEAGTMEEMSNKQEKLRSGDNIKTINGKSILGNGNITISGILSGKLNLADKTAVQNAQKALANTNEIAYYLITDNEGKIPSNVPCYRVPEDVATALGCSSPHTITQSALSLLNISLNGFGVNVGDLIALTRVKVKVGDLASAIGKDLSVLGNTEIEIYQYKILSTNDAKPYGYNDIAEGVAGLMSPWDKEQVNSIRGIAEIAGKALPMPTFNVWDSNMNECFESGIYPWCLTGRPEGSAAGTHYTCVVEKSTTADTSGFYTIVQTCYGREGVDEGKIFKRIIFRKDDGTTNWGVGWKRIDEGALDSLGAFIEENLATKDEVDTAIANAITKTLNTPV